MFVSNRMVIFLRRTAAPLPKYLKTSRLRPIDSPYSLIQKLNAAAQQKQARRQGWVLKL
jgi:hypothetical protein